MLDQPLIANGAGKDGQEVRTLLDGARIALRPAVVGTRQWTVDELVVDLSGGRPGTMFHDEPFHCSIGR